MPDSCLQADYSLYIFVKISDLQYLYQIYGIIQKYHENESTFANDTFDEKLRKGQTT